MAPGHGRSFRAVVLTSLDSTSSRVCVCVFGISHTALIEFPIKPPKACACCCFGAYDDSYVTNTGK